MQRTTPPAPAPTACAFYGANHIRSMLDYARKPPMSDIGELAADILGDVFRGIYHLDDRILKRVDWSDRNCIQIDLPARSLDTYDGDELTRLVVLAHDRAVRVSIGTVVRHWKLLNPDDFESAVLMPEGWNPLENDPGTADVWRDAYDATASVWKRERQKVERPVSAQAFLRIQFHKREREAPAQDKDGWGFSRRHPTIERAIEAVRKTSGTMTHEQRRELLARRARDADVARAEALRAVMG